MLLFNAFLGFAFCAIQIQAHPHTNFRRHLDGPSTCTRVLFGTVNETFPDHIHRNGIYRHMDVDYNGFPVFKHETQDEFLYFNKDADLSDVTGQWVIGKQPHIDKPEIRLSYGPLLGGQWEVKTNERWVMAAETAKAHCVDDIEVTTCSSGKLQLVDLTDHHRKMHEKRMGTYLLTSLTHQLRPVYQHAETREYLFFNTRYWFIGSHFGQDNFSMFAMDDAFKPEFIVQPWNVLRMVGPRPFVEPDNKLRLICEGIGDDIREDGESEEPSNNGPPPLPGWDMQGSLLPENEAVDKAVLSCDDVNCQNNGTCSATVTGGYLCNCHPGYFGQLCGKAIRCPQPPLIRNGYATAFQKEWSFLDVVVYKCRTNGYIMKGDSGVVCQADGSWSRPPKCTRIFSVAPEVPVFPRPPGRRRSIRG